MQKSVKRLTSVFLIALLICTMLPMSAFAANDWATTKPSGSVVSVYGTTTTYGDEKNAIISGPLYSSKWYTQVSPTTNTNNQNFTIPEVSELFTIADGWELAYVSVAGNSSGNRQPGSSFLLSSSGGSMVYYFQQKAVTTNYSLSYDGNGATSGVPATQTGSSTTGSYTFTVSTQKPVRDGYEFLGWSSILNGSADIGTTVALTSTAPSKTIYAVWKEIPAQTYTVTYTDGVEDEEIFADQVISDLLSGAATPAFDGTPTREGYVFYGWNPAVAEKVTGNATYTATWEADANGNGQADKDEEKYTVTYTDGVEGEEVFADQVISGLLSGTATPMFNGTPVRKGYTFKGWNPAVSEKVDGNAVYTAEWQKNSSDPTEPKTGNLIISKTISGKAADSSKSFSFTVTLGDKTINGTYGDIDFVKGVATFTLKGGESKKATDLPNGVGYAVTEADYTSDGYVTTKSGDVGTITDGKTVTAAFTNTKNTTPPTPPTDPDVGNLTVSKTISGNAADKTKAFSFTVTLGNKTISGTYGEMTFTSGVATFTLKGGESKTATGLPAGTGFAVTEADYSADGYVTTKSGDTGKIADGKTVTAAFTNTKNNTTPPTPPVDPKFGNLTISKNVTGDLGDKTKYFTFKVEFDVDGTFNYSGSKTGTITSGGTVQLKHGESITIVDIPAGASYTVTESGNSGYSVYASGDTGIISDGKTSTAKFTNTRSSVPKTGDNSNMMLWLSLMGVSILGMFSVLFIKTNKRRKAAHLRNK